MNYKCLQMKSERDAAREDARVAKGEAGAARAACEGLERQV